MIIDINNMQHYNFIYRRSPKLVVIFFRQGQADSDFVINYVRKLARDPKYIYVTFVSVEYDFLYDISDLYDIDKPPTLLFFNNKQIIKRLDTNVNEGQIYDVLQELIYS